jgi:glycosyltransferase involved in cell wall biosynthesis
MKLAFLNIYSGIVDRGAEVFVQEMAWRLAKNHRVDIYCAKGKISEAQARSQELPTFLGKILYKFYLDAHSRRVLRFTLGILPQIIKKNYDFIIPVDGGWQLLILKILQKFKRFKILVSGQAGIGRDDLRNLKMEPDIFVALTPRAYQWAKEVSPQVKVVYIPNGVDLTKFTPEVAPAEMNLERPVILCVAGLNSYKRVDLTIKAVAGLKKGSLFLIGDGPERARIEKLAKELLGKRFLRITVPHKDLPPYFRAADLFTLVSSSSEAFGIAYLEAMACNLPVVATDDEMRRQIVGEAGLFVDPTDIKEYTNTLEEVLKIDLGQKPRRQAQQFSWDKISQEYERVMIKMTATSHEKN